MKTLGEIVKDAPLHFVQKEQTVLEAVQLMTEQRIGALPASCGPVLRA